MSSKKPNALDYVKQDSNGAWIRIRNDRAVGNCSEEFNWVIKEITGRNFNETEYDFVEKIDSVPTQLCICSHGIHECMFIKNKITDDVFQVGNVCVKKECDEKDTENLHFRMNHEKCKQCDGYIIRKHKTRDGFCNKICNKKFNERDVKKKYNENEEIKRINDSYVNLFVPIKFY